jgi:hypothetical protein
MPPRCTRIPFRFVDHQLLIVDERQARLHVGARWDAAVEVVIELPQTGQHAERDVELSLGPLAGQTRHAENLAHLGADRYRRLTGRAIEALDLAAFFPDAHQLVETIELVKGCLECVQCAAFVRGPRRQVHLGAHAHARALDDAGLGGLRRHAVGVATAQRGGTADDDENMAHQPG